MKILKICNGSIASKKLENKAANNPKISPVVTKRLDSYQSNERLFTFKSKIIKITRNDDTKSVQITFLRPKCEYDHIAISLLNEERYFSTICIPKELESNNFVDLALNEIGNKVDFLIIAMLKQGDGTLKISKLNCYEIELIEK